MNWGGQGPRQWYYEMWSSQIKINDPRHWQQQSKANELLVKSMYTMNEAELLTGVLEGGTEGGKAIQNCMTEMATSDIPGNTVHPALWRRVTSIIGTASVA